MSENDSDGNAEHPLEHATLALGTRTIRTDFGPFDVHFYRDQARERTMMAVSRGDLTGRTGLLCRVHSSCVTSECLMALDCDCADQLSRGMAAIAAEGRGVLFYLLQEGRGAGLTAKARDRMIVQASENRLNTFDAFAELGLPADLRSYEGVGAMAGLLGMQGPIRLLTNNPEKMDAVASVLAEEKIEVVETVAIRGETSGFNRDYLRAKRRSGHDLEPGEIRRGLLPETSVEVLPPMRSRENDSLVCTARYSLPIGLATNAPIRADWFEMRVIYDLRTARESVLLSFASGDAGNAGRDRAGEAVGMALLDRLPCREATRRETLRRKLQAIRARGCGRVVVHFDESNPLAGDPFDVDTAHFETLTHEILSANFSETYEPDDERTHARS